MVVGQVKKILIADHLTQTLECLSSYLAENGYDIIPAQTVEDALSFLLTQKPHITIVDLSFVEQNAYQLVKSIHTLNPPIPLLITHEQAETCRVIKALQMGVDDFILKPVCKELLLTKVKRIERNEPSAHKNRVISQLYTIHDFSKTVACTHSLLDIVDLIFSTCFELVPIEVALIALFDTKEGETKIYRKNSNSEKICCIESSLSSFEWAVLQWVHEHSHSMYFDREKKNVPKKLQAMQPGKGSIVAVPLQSSKRAFGSLLLSRSQELISFTKEDCAIVDILGENSGCAIGNVYDIGAMNQQNIDLSRMSNYSENFIGLTDLTEVIRNLFTTVAQYFPFDVMACLIINKHSHEFLYWTAKKLFIHDLDEVLTTTLNAHNESSTKKICKKGIQRKPIQSSQSLQSLISFPLSYVQTYPLSWEGFNFGTLYFGSETIPQQRDKNNTFLTSLLNQTRIAMVNARLFKDMKENYVRTIKALAIAVDAKDTYTHGHSENVMKLAKALAIEMKMDLKDIENIRDGGLLHDIGKIGIPGYILNKPGPLTYEEFNGVMKTHSTLGANIVKEVPFLKELYSLILYHHEHYDGSGYPDGLSADSIPLGARILHVADAYEAMTSNRPYRESLSQEDALKKLQKQKGKEFDPEVVDAFVRMVSKTMN